MKISRNTTPAPAPAAEPPREVPGRYPLSLLSVEFGETADALAAKLGDKVFVDQVGMRCVSEATTRELFKEREAERDAAVRRARADTEKLVKQSEQHRREREAVARWRASQSPSGSAVADLHALTEGV